MKIELIDLTEGELVDGYFDYGEGGVRGYGGALDICLTHTISYKKHG